MAAVDQLKTPIRSWGLCLTVAGLPYRYYSRVAPPASLVDGVPSGISYEDLPALLSVSGLDDTLDILSGLSTHATVNVTLASKGYEARSLSDPGIVFGRVSKQSAEWSAFLTEDMDRELTTTSVGVSRSPAALSFPRLMHVDQETVYVTGYASSPYRLTGIVRGVGRSLIQTHAYNGGESTLGVATSTVLTDICTWRTRICTIHACPIFGNGESSGTWVEMLHGVLDVAPEVSENGTRVTLSLAPITALLDTPLITPASNTLTTTLATGYHFFDGTACGVLQHAQACLCDVDITGAYSTVTEVFTPSTLSDEARVLDLVEVGDVSLAGWAPAHPRAITTKEFGIDATALGAGGVLTFPSLLPFSSAVTLQFESKVELFSVNIPASSGVVATRIPLTTSAWTDPTSAIGDADGSWAVVALGADGVVAEKNTSAVSGFFKTFFLWDTGSGDTAYAMDSRFNTDRFKWSSGTREHPPSKARRLWYPVMFLGRDGTPLTNGGNIQGITGPGTVGLSVDISSAGSDTTLGCVWAGGFYQSGEKYLLLRDQITVPCSLRVSTKENGRGDPEGVYYARAVSGFAATDSGGATIGYCVEIHPDDRIGLPSFGTWGLDWEAEPPTIEVVASIVDASGGDTLLRLLTSSGGALVSGNYDTLPIGLGLTSTSFPPARTGPWGPLRIVDEDSFISMSTGGVLGSIDKMTADAETSLRDIARAFCLTSNTTISMVRQSDGYCRLAARPLVPALEQQASAAIGSADWLVSDPPTSRVDSQIITKHVYRCNFDDEGNSLEVAVVDSAAIRAYGPGEELSVDLYGVTLDVTTPNEVAFTLSPIFARISALFGRERLAFSGGIPGYIAAFLSVGDVILISSPHLKGYGPFYGVYGAPVRLTHVQFSFDEEDARIEGVFYDTNGAGINATAQVRFITGTNAVQVYSNAYTPLKNPITGAAMSDISFFAEGDEVVLYQRGSHDTQVPLTIATISGNTVTFTSNHGFTAPITPALYMEPADAYSATAAHLARAYIASDAEVIAGTLPAKILL